jgi:RNA polymerase sigma-70 factor (ECF subfamily)
MERRSQPETGAERRRMLAERELILRCVARDRDACRLLYQRHRPAVSRVLRHHGIADVEADDLCQEIFLIIYRHLGAFRGEGRLRTWIHRLASREATRYIRRGQARRLLVLIRERPVVRPYAENQAPHRRYLDELLSRLSPERRVALVLFEIEGRLVEEIADLCGCAVNTVWTRIHRARAQLAQLAAEGRA